MKGRRKKMANLKVKFLIDANSDTEELYLVGNVKQLGAWDLSKAVKLTLCHECGKYTVTKMLPAGEVVEFKVVKTQDWNSVEKGIWCEDIQNHSFIVEKGLKVEIVCHHFGA